MFSLANVKVYELFCRRPRRPLQSLSRHQRQRFLHCREKDRHPLDYRIVGLTSASSSYFVTSLVVSVTSTGLPIKPEENKQLFERGFRGLESDLELESTSAVKTA